MKKFLKITGIIILLVFIGLSTVIALRQNRKFDAPFPQVTSTNDSNLIARGKHLAFGPAHCVNCHATDDAQEKILKGEAVPLSGGVVFDLPIGKIYSKNLTPDITGIGNRSDEAIARALRYGVSLNGRALFDFMPFHNLSDEDLSAILSYLRHQPPVKNPVPENSFNLLGKVVNAFLLKPVGPSEEVPKVVKADTSAAYGRYLANNVANCRGCHTNRDLMTGAFIGENFAGGLVFETPTDSGKYILTTPNLTPDSTGILRGWTSQQFIKRFRMGKVVPQTHMPWGPFGKMSDDELTAIYNFLHTVKPIHNEIKQTVRFEPASKY